MNFSFAPATRETARARIALQGPGGSGKTKTGLRFAEKFANGGAIGVIDTERGSALKYAPVPGRPDLGGHEFMHLPMAFCSPENLIAAVRAAEEARIAVLFVDSWSHFWAGKGGLLARVEEESKKASNRGGKFTAWAPVNDLEQDMLDALLNFPGHVIVSMRTKNDYSMEGKNVTKVGVKTVQREGSEYEFDVVIDMIEGTGTVTKTRYEPLYNASVHHPGEDFAEVILEQLGQGVDPVQAIADELVADTLTYPRALELHARAKARNLLGADLLHPKTGRPGKLGELIAEYGAALNPQPAAPSAPSPEPTPAGPAPYSASDAVAPEGATGPDRQPAASGSSPVSAPQMRMMHACFAKVGLGAKDQREERLRATGLIIGRQVATANELTFDEAATLLDTLTAYGDFDNPADEFAAMVQGLEDEFAKQPVSA
ncbi:MULTISPECIES: AAA family ATPase [unclassified Streptomyces]|uniref:AAA family ATPase n=1 Tax=unclassified Streptomyces TaxID=2593676 RepID=UPI00081F375C|nr:AAA family ATPase [Streptomyces sp. ScaeMP-e83]MYR93057.1 AAA family ATPase [Streptomyces sp. SID4937]SCD45735.1 AAA domain-containing protein [Streptomyces sp. ScaeMP-e83]